jgi:hypothetical protein
VPAALQLPARVDQKVLEVEQTAGSVVVADQGVAGGARVNAPHSVFKVELWN